MSDQGSQDNNEVVEETALSETEPQDVGDDSSPTEFEEGPRGPSFVERLWSLYVAKKRWTVPFTAVIFLATTLIVPVTRYGLLGTIIHKNVTFRVIDTTTNVPISGVDVTLGGKHAKTNGDGLAIIKGAHLGVSTATASKKYYENTDQNLTIGLSVSIQQIKIKATGKQMPIHVINKITGENISGAVIKAADTEAQTDQNGETTIVLPTTQAKIPTTITAKGYNDQKVDVVSNTSSVKDNTFSMTTAGKLYFLSKQANKVNVVKTNLDGSDQRVVVEGTGNEDASNTVLLATRDWKYLVLQARRDGNSATLYLLDTSNDKLTEIDSGDVSFSLVGWSEHNLVYQLNRNNIPDWQAKDGALKSYNADSRQSVVIDETNAEGTGQNDFASEAIGNVYILKDKLVYTKGWHASYYSVYRLANKQMTIYTASASGGGKQTVKDFAVGNNGYINASLVKPNDIYFGVYNAATAFYDYNGSSLNESKNVRDDSFKQAYPAYVVSPSANTTLWLSGGVLYTGNATADVPKQLDAADNLAPYGWYGDAYVLLSQNGHIFIQPSAGLGPHGQLIKIGDYAKPNYSSLGYVGSYGGL